MTTMLNTDEMQTLRNHVEVVLQCLTTFELRHYRLVKPRALRFNATPKLKLSVPLPMPHLTSCTLRIGMFLELGIRGV